VLVAGGMNLALFLPIGAASAEFWGQRENKIETTVWPGKYKLVRRSDFDYQTAGDASML
jgi:hypothetical protein